MQKGAPVHRNGHSHLYQERTWLPRSPTHFWVQCFQRDEKQVVLSVAVPAALTKCDLSKPSLFHNSLHLPDIHPWRGPFQQLTCGLDLSCDLNRWQFPTYMDYLSCYTISSLRKILILSSLTMPGTCRWITVD